jgi:hypothetical protein
VQCRQTFAQAKWELSSLCVVAGHFLVEKPWEIPSLFQRCDLRRYGTAVDDFFVFY